MKHLKFFLFFFSFLLLGSGFFLLFFQQQKEEKMRIQKREEEKALVQEIQGHYNTYVKTTKEATLYHKQGKKYVSVGTAFSGVEFTLDSISIHKDTKYFLISDSDFYISYQDVEPISSLSAKDLRYTHYLPFNENVVTNDITHLYLGDALIFELDFSLDLPIIRKNSDGYYVEYFNQLFFVPTSDVQKTYAKENTTEEEASKVPVTVYHFIYLNGDVSCNEIICHSEEQIRSHFQYLKEQNYFTLTTTELGLFLKGEIRLPSNSILITIDDGARAWNFLPILEEYQVNATLFLVSSWYDEGQFSSPYMEIASHTHNLHTPGVCSGGQGSPLKCLNMDELVLDLKTSRETLNGTKAFCYPFYEYNQHAIEAVQAAGFELGFIGGGVAATPGVNLYKIPRITIHKTTSLEQYIRYIS